jgi:hypothetical protein
MKKNDYIYLFLAFILGYFAQSIIKQRCGTVIEGSSNEETICTTNSSSTTIPSKNDFINDCLTQYKYYCAPDENNWMKTHFENCCAEIDTEVENAISDKYDAARKAATFSCSYAYNLMIGKTGYDGCVVYDDADDAYLGIDAPEDFTNDDIDHLNSASDCGLPCPPA